ncbi:MAG: hypothetical protein C0603_01455 [Denitrovibrio sp.]|nr:MAG: hypothetical protein C0603_01455 [Denitrovibrio sp.]
MKQIKYLPLLLLIVLTGCIQMNMRFQPTSALKNEYNHTAKDANVTIHYSVKKTADGASMVKMAVQNTARVYMRNLTINYDECCQVNQSGPGKYRYQNLGNLKNRAHTPMSLKIPAGDFKSIKLKYSYTPVMEDGFLKTSNSDQAPIMAETVHGEVVLFIR